MRSVFSQWSQSLILTYEESTWVSCFWTTLWLNLGNSYKSLGHMNPRASSMEYGDARMRFWWPGESSTPQRSGCMVGRSKSLQSPLSLEIGSLVHGGEVNSKFRIQCFITCSQWQWSQQQIESLFCVSLFYCEQFAEAGSRLSSDFYGCNKTLARLFVTAKQIIWDLQTAVELTCSFSEVQPALQLSSRIHPIYFISGP